MKKIGWMILVSMALALVLSASAMAATAVSVNGKIYTFLGEETVLQADGMTFILEGNTVRIQEPGKEDRVLPLTAATEAIAIEDASPLGVDEACTELVSEADVKAGSAAQTAVASSVDQVIVPGDGDIDAAAYDAYAPYGLYYDVQSNILYHQGKRVRIFEDIYFEDANTAYAVGHFDPDGVVDIDPVRDMTAGGALTGLRVATDAEFASRDLTAWISPGDEQAVTASEGSPMTPAQKQALYAPYAALGLIYDASTDSLRYQGQSVRSFLDVRQSNGEDFAGGRFKGSMTKMTNDDGEIDVTILRDYTQLDAQGDGTITGIEVRPAQ